MPPFLSLDDFHKLVQKIAVLETKTHRLAVNVEVNGLCGNDSTLPLTQKSGHEDANSQLVSTNKTAKKQEGPLSGSKYTGSSPPLNSFGAKLKNKS